jgi:hypothetical protein
MATSGNGDVFGHEPAPNTGDEYQENIKDFDRRAVRLVREEAAGLPIPVQAAGGRRFIDSSPSPSIFTVRQLNAASESFFEGLLRVLIVSGEGD